MRRRYLPVLMMRGGAAEVWTPASLGSTLKLWLAARDEMTVYIDSGVTLVSADGDAVEQINDKSGNGNHYRKTLTASKPTWRTNVQNGLSVLRGATDDFMTGLNTLSLNDLTIYVVVKPSASGSEAMIGSASNNTFYFNSNSYIQFVSPGNAYDAIAYGSGFQIMGVSRTMNSTITMRRNGSELNLNANPNQTSAFVARNIFAWAQGGGYLSGDIGEIIICDTVLSAGDITSLETYLNNLWGVY